MNTIFVLLTAVNESEENGLTAKASDSFWTSSANRSLKDSVSSWCFLCFLYVGLSDDEDCLFLLSSKEERMFDSSLPQSSHLCREESFSRTSGNFLLPTVGDFVPTVGDFVKTERHYLLSREHFLTTKGHFLLSKSLNIFPTMGNFVSAAGHFLREVTCDDDESFY